MYEILAQWAQYNKFVESGSKNKALMSWTTISTELNDNQTQIRGFDINGPSIRGGHTCINWSQLDTETVQIATVLSFYFSPLLLSHGGFLSLYISSWVILILHLLIIWSFTWVPVPSDTLSGILWVVVVKAILFRGHLNINVARKIAVVHSMRW